MSSSINDPSTQARQARVGLRIAGLLSTSAASTAPDLTERLRFAREQALSRARQQRTAAAPGIVQGGSVALGSSDAPAWWLRVLAMVPLVLLLAGLGLVEHWSQREQVLAAADVDAVLLADDLPPGAYSDPGFGEFLRSAPR